MKRKPAARATAKARLFDAVMGHIAKHSGDCTIGTTEGYLMAFVSRKFTTVTTIGAEGFQPYTKQEDVKIPVPVLLVFDRTRQPSRSWLGKFAKLGGQVVMVRRLEDATEALHG
jgi:hypothetical protein